MNNQSIKEEFSRKKIGPYELLQSIGKGGMGEVYLAYDLSCGRQVALKKIRPEYAQNKTMQDRFLREAKIAAQLAHPSIIPIYAIHQDKDAIYYTMPYVEGETLKAILRTTREQEREEKPQHPIGSSIPSLIRIFLNVCQAIAYAHDKCVLHRDLKPENIIIGKYGEVLILDWGLADFISAVRKEDDLPLTKEDDADLTQPGKIPGTLAYLPPERALGEEASALTDIYSLGVILYQLLTLQLPFYRKTLKEFRKQLRFERLLDPEEVAPYRDIPLQLSSIVKRCLAADKEKRYQSVQEILVDLQNYIEGVPEWLSTTTLDIEQKEDWEFQENILLAKHIAITGNAEVMEWVNLMISKRGFTGNIRLETRVKLGKNSHGIGLLICLPEPNVRQGLEDGYCLWIGCHSEAGCALYRCNIEVMHQTEIALNAEEWHMLRLEKVENHVRFYVDGQLKLSYLSHAPMTGSHIGLLMRDADLQLEPLKVLLSSQNVMVNCLAVPDAFLSKRDYAQALLEYRRIASSFPGRAEGREATFRAGITLLEEALTKKKAQKEELLERALSEFERLHFTPGAPLEYLGKSLVYKACKDFDEEVKCLELALRKFPKHPLLPILAENINFRLHESSRYDRLAAYQFALLALRFLPKLFSHSENLELLQNLITHSDPLPFLEMGPNPSFEQLSIQLAFWLAKPLVILEIIQKSQDQAVIKNGLFALLELGQYSSVKEQLPLLKDPVQLEIALLVHEKGVDSALQRLFEISTLEFRTLAYVFKTALSDPKKILPYFAKIDLSKLSSEEKSRLSLLQLWALLLAGEWDQADKLFKNYPKKQLRDEKNPLFPLYGCFLHKAVGKKAAQTHFSSVTSTPFPRLSALLSHFLLGEIDQKKGWILHAFVWEKCALYRYLNLYYHCCGQQKLSKIFFNKIKKLLQKIG